MKKEAEDLQKAINATQSAMDSSSMQKSLDLINAEADAFGSLAGKIEVVNYQLQSQEKVMKKMTQAYVDQDESIFGKMISMDDLKAQAALINQTKAMMSEMEAASDVQFASDMDRALGTAASNMALMESKADSLRKKLESLAAEGKANTAEFKEFAKSLKNTENQMMLMGQLEGTFTDFFMMFSEGFKNIGEQFEEWIKSVLNGLMRLVAEMLAKKIVSLMFPADATAKQATATAALAGAQATATGTTATLNGIMGVTAGVAKTAAAAVTDLAVAQAASAGASVPWPGTPAAIAMNVGAVTASIIAAQASLMATKLEDGGIIPPGFPNDTFNARLSSNEAVIPLDRLNEYDFGSNKLEGEIVVRIKGDELVGILKKQGKKFSTY
jgi:hypothetical protein